MKKILICLALLHLCVFGRAQSDTLLFENERQLLDFAFQNINMEILNSQFITNRTLTLADSVLQEATSPIYLSSSSSNKTMQFMTYLDWWDASRLFKRDTLIYQHLADVHVFDDEAPVDFPIFLADVKLLKVLPSIWNNFLNSGENPLPNLNNSDFSQSSITYGGFLEDVIPTNKIKISFPSNYIIENNGRSITHIELTLNGQSFILLPNQSIDLSNILESSQDINMVFHFDDLSTYQTSQKLEVLSSPKSTLAWGDYSELYQIKMDDASSDGLNNPKVRFRIFYSCPDKKLRKPFIVLTGFGSETDKTIINNQQGWPTPYATIVNNLNVENLFGELRDDGFDIVFAQFLPPNASVSKNADVVVKLIDWVNLRKVEDGSYEENILMGYSSGALTAKFALLKLEKRHLEQNGAHPHTKLFISNEGENKGANIPLGMQHTIDYLMQYEYNWYNYKLYALNYIINAPQTKDLLYYFHSETGNGDNPGQDMSPNRTTYLNLQNTFNHSLNGSALGYPSFQRKISISNGSSTPAYDLSTNSVNHPPFPSEMGHIFLKQTNSSRRWQASFLNYGEHRVFYFEKKPLFKPWKIIYEAVTENALLLDNAPGGIFPIEQNPMKDIIDVFDSEIDIGSLDIALKSQFSFTPTIFTHDVKNLAGILDYGYLNYNFKGQKLMYDDEIIANLNNQAMASNFYGYPHLGYPSFHYDITPFDALFTFNENTEHVTGLRKHPTQDIGIPSPMQPELKSVILEEAEGNIVYLQNKRIGHFARPNYQLRVDYSPAVYMFMGEHVTQKTDFLPVVFETNCEVEAMAGEAIIIKTGVHIKNGAKVHLFIGELACTKSAFSVENEDNSEEDLPNEFGKTEVFDMKDLTVFPNPSNGTFTINSKIRPKSAKLEVKIYSTTGLLCFSNHVALDQTIQTNLPTGLYILTLLIDDKWRTLKISIAN